MRKLKVKKRKNDKRNYYVMGEKTFSKPETWERERVMYVYAWMRMKVDENWNAFQVRQIHTEWIF